MKKRVIHFGAILAICFSSLSAFGQPFVSPYKMRLRPFLTGFGGNPVLLTNAGDGSKRLFVVQQSGVINVIQPGSTVPTTFLNLSAKVSFVNEEGLLGLAFHPDFASNGKFYVYYNRAGDGTITVSEFRVSTDPNQGDPATERMLLTIPHPNTNHNGGMMAFGPDGYLYMGTGDGGSANDPPGNAQNRSVLLGKMLRIDVNIPIGSPNPYLIPPTNPFVGANTARCDTGSTAPGNTCQEIWAYGMRNPWRWSFDRDGTNQLYVADVGQGAIEELDIVTGGGNYGWRVYEGTQCTGLDPNLCVGGSNPITQIPPFFQYTHLSGRCAVTGGYVYRGTQGSLPFGAYIFADYCSGEIWQWQNNTQTLLQDTPRLITSFGEDEDGEIYVCYQNGQIDKIARARAPSDFDGDAKTDVSVYRPTAGNWYALNSSNGSSQAAHWGIQTDVPVPQDYDGDNIRDFAVWRPMDGNWYVIRSSDSTVEAVHWGNPGDITVVGDYDGDGKGDFGIYRPSTGFWFPLRSSDFDCTPAFWGIPNSDDRPAQGDFDGDGKTDVTIYRPSEGNWFWINSSNGAIGAAHWGISTDINVQADYDGDGKTDIAVYRPSEGNWYIINSQSGSVSAFHWGLATDVPVPGDYDGDGKTDVTAYRPSEGNWYIINSQSGSVSSIHWGAPGDIPVPAFDAH